MKEEHLEGLPTPEGIKNYQFILERSIDQTAKNWAIFSQALVGDTSHLLNEIGNWNMGTGKIDKTSFAYWRSNT